ncbi:MAG TPA: GSCFA domain-containing protein, partial [Chitinophagales bacterium]
KENNKIVSNCHKIPAKNFERKILSSNETVEILSQTIQDLLRINRDLKIVFTVSPIRYLAFGAFENSVSKGNLFSAVNALLVSFSNVSYFPSYEIVMDELRDYRFYNEDMLHPNSLAINYVFEKMAKVYFSEKTQELNRQIREIIQAGTHRPRNAESVAHKQFLAKYISKIQTLSAEFPLLNFQPEMKKLMQ